jgi:hypothetical protein
MKHMGRAGRQPRSGKKGRGGCYSAKAAAGTWCEAGLSKSRDAMRAPAVVSRISLHNLTLEEAGAAGPIANSQ